MIQVLTKTFRENMIHLILSVLFLVKLFNKSVFYVIEPKEDLFSETISLKTNIYFENCSGKF